jgi:hypothetical protein
MNQKTMFPEPKWFYWGQRVKTPLGSGSIQGHDGNGCWLVAIEIKTMPPEERARHRGEWFYILISEELVEKV